MGFFSRAANLAKGIVKTVGASPNEAALRALDEELAAPRRPTTSPAARPAPPPEPPAAPSGPERDEHGEVKRTL